MKERAALGLKVRTGRAIAVVVGGPPESPAILLKALIQVASSFDEGAVFHVGQGMPVEAARAFVQEAESRFTERARAELAALTERLGTRIAAAGMAADPAKRLPPLESILKSHALVHAAEGELYRRVFAEAALALGVRPLRVPAEELDRRAAAALGIAPAKLAAHLLAMGKASGRPWAADQKQATLVAWLALAAPSETDPR